MTTPPENRDLGPQPLGELLAARGLERSALVAASTEQLTFKQVTRAVQGRWLTPRMRAKVLHALEAATGERFRLDELFAYD